MAKLTIQTGKKNAILRSVSAPVRADEFKKFERLASDMLRYIKNEDNGGVGLAAPQIGVNKRIIVVSLMKDYEDENFRTIVMVNPEIIEHSETREIAKEGCLSVPGESGNVARYQSIRLAFLDIKGVKFILNLSDLAARIVQHEIDHLDGILFTDKLEVEEKK